MSLHDDGFLLTLVEPRGPNEKLKAMWDRYQEIQDARARAEAAYEKELTELRATPPAQGNEK